jgi:uncharacterized membrane protein
LPAATAQSYVVRELPPLTGNSYSFAPGINGSGVAVGQSGVADSVAVAVRWINGVPQSLGTLPGYPSALALDVSDDGGRVIGLSYFPNQAGLPFGLGLPFVWEAGVMNPLPLPSGLAHGEASQIKDTGETIVGTAYNVQGNNTRDDVACRWDWDGSTSTWNVTVLPDFGGPGHAYAIDINAGGSIFGYTSGALGPYRACRWGPGMSAPTDLGCGDDSWVNGGNNLNECVGSTADGTALLWLPAPAYDRQQGPNDLGTLPGFIHSVGIFINNWGTSTGIAWNSGNPWDVFTLGRAFIWQNGAMQAANTLIPAQPAWNIRQLQDINDNGQAVGLGVRSGLLRAVILTPCLSDIDRDADCDLNDLAILLAHFGSSNAAYTDGDINGDGVVDLDDLSALLSNFGTTCA